jgi:hypothetical protein
MSLWVASMYVLCIKLVPMQSVASVYLVTLLF